MKGLLKLARKTLEAELERKKVNVSDSIKKKYNEEKACFVTLTENEELRGCVGSLQAHQELWKDIIDNAINAGFRDYRFSPLVKEELNKIKIEISILTKPEELKYKNEKDLLDKIDKKMGLILRKQGRSATFLPQVWKKIPSKKEFLEHLCLKAGLNKEEWKDSEIWFYRVKKIEE